MAGTQVQLRRGTTAENNAFTGVQGELTHDTQTMRLRTHDGATLGGFEVALMSDVALKLSLSGGTMSGAIAMGGFQINNLGAPTVGGDATNKTYVDAAVAAVATAPFTDSTAIVKGSGDPTKLLRFEIDGLTAATTRVLTPQDASYTIAGLETLNVFTVSQAITLAAANTTALTISGYSLTGANAQSCIDISGNWNTTGIPTAIKMNITDFTSSPLSYFLDFQRESVSRFSVSKFGVTTITYLFIGTLPISGLILQNTTAAAAGAQQYSPSILLTGQGWKLNAVAASQPVDWRIFNQTVQGSTAPSSNLLFEISVNGGAFFTLLSLAASSGTVIVTGTLQATSSVMSPTGIYSFSTRSRLASSADGIIELFNAAQTAFTRLNFGGTTSSFPSIRRTTTALNIRLADDSADAGLTALSITTSQTTFMHITSAALANGAAAQVGTLTNAPTAGDPTKWIPINDNGTTRYIPAW